MKDILKNKWLQAKEKIKSQWNKVVAPDDLSQVPGSSKEMEELLRRRHGYEKEHAKRNMLDFIKEHKFDKTKFN